MKLQDLERLSQSFGHRQNTMPVLFIGHGHPLGAVLDNTFSRTLQRLGSAIATPAAILVISAHWETVGTFVGVNAQPRTIYDFGNFDERLYQLSYQAPGAPLFARELQQLVTLTNVEDDAGMGFDHGAWTILKHIRPQADVPVFEMSIDHTQGAGYHYRLGKQLRGLRDKGVLIICSGNIVHNLRLTDWKDIDARPHDWNLEFDDLVKRYIDSHRFEELVRYQQLGAAARLAIPTNDHYLPMIYALGLIRAEDPITHLYEGYQFAGISMRCFQAG